MNSAKHPYQKFDYAFNETQNQNFAEISEDEKSEAMQRLELLADETREENL